MAPVDTCTLCIIARTEGRNLQPPAPAAPGALRHEGGGKCGNRRAASSAVIKKTFFLTNGSASFTIRSQRGGRRARGEGAPQSQSGGGRGESGWTRAG